jgi:hypothetical protein
MVLSVTHHAAEPAAEQHKSSTKAAIFSREEKKSSTLLFELFACSVIDYTDYSSLDSLICLFYTQMFKLQPRPSLCSSEGS